MSNQGANLDGMTNTLSSGIKEKNHVRFTFFHITAASLSIRYKSC